MKVDRYQSVVRRPEEREPEPLAVGEAQAAKLLGVSARHLWELRKRGEGPRHARIGNAVRYSVAELNRYLADRTAAAGIREVTT
jgi:predicted DNA-binding transcriptional regulator AlpA